MRIFCGCVCNFIGKQMSLPYAAAYVHVDSDLI